MLAPVFALPTPAIDFDDFLSADATRELFDRMRCVMWVNCLSLPGVALGNGAQLVGRRFQDREVLAAARTARAALGGHGRMNANAVVAVVVIVASAAGAVIVGAMFIWAARKDGEEDVALQKKLGRRRKTRL